MQPLKALERNKFTKIFLFTNYREFRVINQRKKIYFLILLEKLETFDLSKVKKFGNKIKVIKKYVFLIALKSLQFVRKKIFS